MFSVARRLWPLAARAQQAERMRRIGVLCRHGGRCGIQDPRRGVLSSWQLLGWTIGRNMRIDTRWTEWQCRRRIGKCGRIGRARAGCHPGPWHRDCGPLLQATRTVPIVFPVVGDPVGAGFVDSLARPGGNATGFMHFEYSHERKMAGAAQTDRARRDARGGPSGYRGIAPDPASSASSRPWRRHSGWRSTPVNMRDAGEIERDVTAFARVPNGGLIVTGERVGDTSIAI